MLDSISIHREPTNHQIEQFKEFTFGKEEVEYTLYDKIKEENLKKTENDLNFDADVNNISYSKGEQLDNLAVIDPAQS